MALKFNPFTGKFDLVEVAGGSDTQVQFNDGGVFGGDAGLTYAKATDTLSIGNANINATLGSELAPALTTGNWTLGTGWRYLTSPNRLDKNADGTGTATPTAATNIVAGVTYKVVITVDSISGSTATYTLGGVGGTVLTVATTYTDYITASTTGKLIITPVATGLRITISAISIKALTDATGDLTVDGNLTVRSPAYFMGNVGIGTMGLTSKVEIITGTSQFRISNTSGTGGVLDIRGNSDSSTVIQMNAYTGTPLLRFQSSGQADLVAITNTGRLGIGTTTPDTLLQLANNNWFSAKDFAGTSYVNIAKVNASDEIDVGGLLNIAGGLEAPADSGAIVLFDMPVVSALINVEQSATMRLDSNNLFKFYCESDGAGGIQNLRNYSYGTLYPRTGNSAAGTAPIKFTAGTLLTTPEAGVMEYDGNCLSHTNATAIRECISGNIFAQTADQTVGNTTTETTLIGSGVGTLTLPANFFKVGKTVRIRLRGHASNTGTPGFTIRAKLGSTVVVSTTSAVMSKNITQKYCVCEVILTCRTVGATGTIQGVGSFEHDATGNSAEIYGMVNTSAATIDTTASQALNVTFQWGTQDVANTLTSQIGIVEILN